MKTLRTATWILGAALAALAAGLSHAQATRTWVSGVGDDVNPCSRTAPCKTFAGAISKTAVGGEISVLDPGGYGTVTITKSITIDGGQGAGFGSILNAGINGVNVNAAGIVVTLRNLHINGTSTTSPGLAGIKIFNAAKVFIENCTIFGQGGSDPNGRGISDVRTTGGQLFVTDTIVRNNSQSGLVVQSGGAAIDVTITRSSFIGNGNAGIAATGGAHITMNHSTASGNGNIGVYVEQAAGTTTKVSISESVLSDNSTGLFMSSGTPFVFLSGVVITNNDTGVSNIGGGTIFSHMNNRVSGNPAGNTPVVTQVGSL